MSCVDRLPVFKETISAIYPSGTEPEVCGLHVVQLIKKSFQAKKKVLSGILNLADAAIEKADRLAVEVKQYQIDQADWEPADIADMEAADPGIIANVAEAKFRYGAEAFEAYQKETAKAMVEDKAAKNASAKSRKSR